MTFVSGLKNVQVKVKECELIKSGHLAIEVLIEDTQNNLKHKPKFKTKKVQTGIIGKNTSAHLSNCIDNFPDNITEDQIKKPTDLSTNIIVTTVNEYFGLIQASKKIKKKGGGVKT